MAPKVTVTFRWDKDLLSQVDAAARNAGTNRAGWVEQMMREQVASDEAPDEGVKSGKKAPTGSIHSRDCPHAPGFTYRHLDEGIYCSQCRKYVIMEDD